MQTRAETCDSAFGSRVWQAAIRKYLGEEGRDMEVLQTYEGTYQGQSERGPVETVGGARAGFWMQRAWWRW